MPTGGLLEEACLGGSGWSLRLRAASKEGTIMPIEHSFDSHFRYVLVAARRARQLQQGAAPLVAGSSSKPQKIAQEEIDSGQVGFLRKERRKVAEIEEVIVPRFAP